MKLLESEPVEIQRWCARMREVSPDETREMTIPLTKLDYNQMNPELVEQVEDAIFFGMCGVERPHQEAA